MSFDDTPVVRFAQPPLTAVDPPIAKVARRAVERIVAGQRNTLPHRSGVDPGEAERPPIDGTLPMPTP